MTSYTGHYIFDRIHVSLYSPENKGVYYCGYVNSSGNLVVLYVGNSTTSIRERLQDHLSSKRWPDVTHFGFKKCLADFEAENLERSEILNFNPKYNTQGTF